MKKLALCATLAIVALAFSSCGKKDYKSFIGTWGVEKIEYYNTDYAGNPIAATLKTYKYDPADTDNGIHLVFKEDKTGEMRDSAVDTVWTEWNSQTQTYESYIVNPDTILIDKFDYSYDKSEKILYMNMDYSRTFKLNIIELNDDAFVYENEYDANYTEKAYLKRVSDKSSKSANRQKAAHPNRPGSFLGSRH